MHSENYVAKISRLTLCSFLSLPDITDQELDEDGLNKLISWQNYWFLMFDNDIDDDSENISEDYGSDIKSNSEEDESRNWIQFISLICALKKFKTLLIKSFWKFPWN